MTTNSDVELIREAARNLLRMDGGSVTHQQANELRALADRLSRPVEAVAEVISTTNGSYHTNYKLRWIGEAREGDKLYTKPFPASAPAGVPDGWMFCAADFSVQAAGKSDFGNVILIRNAEGKAAWHGLNDEEKDVYDLYVYGKGKTVSEAIADASAKAMLTAAPAPAQGECK